MKLITILVASKIFCPEQVFVVTKLNWGFLYYLPTYRRKEKNGYIHYQNDIGIGLTILTLFLLLLWCSDCKDQFLPKRKEWNWLIIAKMYYFESSAIQCICNVDRFITYSLAYYFLIFPIFRKSKLERIVVKTYTTLNSVIFCKERGKTSIFG